eukprot:6070916-Ditylum_brightwellii.AAC.1
MEIKQTKAIVGSFFVFLHVKFHSQKDAATEIKYRAHIDSFDLHVHTCCHMQQRHTNAIAVSCRQSMVREIKSKLYRMNNQRPGEKDRYPHTKHWIFVPFKEDGTIAEKHITMMIQKQNAYLHGKTTILVMGLHNISELVMIPGTTTLLSFHRWLLSVKTSD